MNKTKECDKRTKLIQEKCNNILNKLLRDEDNKYCVDCDSKGPRWASWNLGIFLCIRCAGIHRNLGVHISRVKSVNLDSWTPEQVVSLQQMGNSRARAVYEALLSDGFRRPQTDSGLESFIRAKYEQKKYIAREWIPPPTPKVDWDKEIDEELENQKRKKKPATMTTTIPEPAKITTPVAIPAPLPKPKVNSNSPKTSRLDSKRTSSSSSSNNTSANSSDLLGLSTTTPSQNTSAINKSDSFDSFLCDVSGTSSAIGLTTATNQNSNDSATNGSSTNTINSLEKEEKDFFNQSINNGVTDKGKMTKDSILALYGMNSYAQAGPPPQAVYPGMPAAGYGYPPQQPNPHQQIQMFPNLMMGAQQQMPLAGPSQPLQQDQFFNFGTRLPLQQQQPPPAQGQFMNLNHNNNGFGNFAVFPGTSAPNSYQQFNTQKLNEDNIKKIESLNFNNLK